MRRLAAVLIALSLLGAPAFSQIPDGGDNIVINSTPISNGTNGLCLFDNNGKVGEQACGGAGGVTSFNTRTGAVVPASNDYSISQISGLGMGVATALGNTAGGAGGFALVGTTPPTGAAGGSLKGTYPNPGLADINTIATSLAIGGATIGTNALAVTGTGAFSTTGIFGGLTILTAGTVLGNNLFIWSAGMVQWASGGAPTGTPDLTISRNAAGVGQIGTTASNALGSLLLTNLTGSGATIIFNGLSTDAAATDVTVCSKSADGTLLKGSGTLGICLGTSGRQFKTAFQPMTAGLDELMKISLQNYRYKKGYGDDGERIQYGTTAQDVEAVIPNIARHDASGQTINYDSGALLFVGLRAIQQLKLENNELRDELRALQRIRR